MALGNDPGSGKNGTAVERVSERAFVVRRTFNAPARVVFDAWTRPELLMRWWAPKSYGISFVSCEADVRTGGAYRFVFSHPGSDQPMAFFGRYVDVTPPFRLVWTNEEGGDQGPVTTVTFEERGAETLLVMHDLYPSKEALDEAIGSENTIGICETLDQLDAFLSAGRRLAGCARAGAFRRWRHVPKGSPAWATRGREWVFGRGPRADA